MITPLLQTVTTPRKSEKIGNNGSSRPTVLLPQSSKKPLLSELDLEDMYVIEDQDEPVSAQEVVAIFNLLRLFDVGTEKAKVGTAPRNHLRFCA